MRLYDGGQQPFIEVAAKAQIPISIEQGLANLIDSKRARHFAGSAAADSICDDHNL
ncbi:MAG TPA: hypothetical protein VMF32_11175 [Xanthobacteraceae bacterium]|nr:hypothetical protein [Xanthobacteraceae bacterium]